MERELLDKQKETNSKFRKCRMCNKNIPPSEYYPAEWCGMCLRESAEKEYHRYYVRNPEGYGEEVQELAGLFAFSEENKPLIKEAMARRLEEYDRKRKK